MKQCFKCLCVKPLDGFYAHKKMADGRLNECKECTKRDVGEYRAVNIEKIRARERSRNSLQYRIDARRAYAATEAGRAAHARAVAASNERAPERRAARVAVGNAVRRGQLRPWPCEICGAKADAHHPHYGAPLLVTWLCGPHHKQAHAESG